MPDFESERKRSMGPATRVLTTGIGRASIHDLMAARSLSKQPVNLDTPLILLMLSRKLAKKTSGADPLNF